MEGISIAQPIPQQQIYFDNLSSSSSVVTPSSLSFEMDKTLLKEQCIHFGCPPPDSNPIPFDSIDFSNFHADFNSPTEMRSNDFSEDFSDENTFNYRL